MMYKEEMSADHIAAPTERVCVEHQIVHGSDAGKTVGAAESP